MKRVIIIFGVFILFLVGSFLVSAASDDSGEEEESFLANALKLFSFEWLFKNIMLGVEDAYGKCAFASECGEPAPIGERKCEVVNNILSVIQLWKKFECIEGKCEERLSSEIIDRCEKGCEKGKCIVCRGDYDCPYKERLLGYKCGETSEKPLYERYESYVCRNPGASDSYCEKDRETLVLKDECSKYDRLKDRWRNPVCYCPVMRPMESICTYFYEQGKCSEEKGKCIIEEYKEEKVKKCLLNGCAGWLLNGYCHCGEVLEINSEGVGVDAMFDDDNGCFYCKKCELGADSKCVPDPLKNGKICNINEEIHVVGSEKIGICYNGKCIESICNPPPKDCEKCDDKLNPPKAVADTNKDGAGCNINGKEGYCKNGKCVERTCKNLGLGQSCGSSDFSQLNCCKNYPIEKCCSKGNVGTEACCIHGNDANPMQICSTLAGRSICLWNVCADPSRPVRCPSTGMADKTTCCPTGSVCIYQGGGLFPKIYSCGKKSCGTGEFKCPSSKNPFGGGVLCCKTGFEECDSVAGYYVCKEQECPTTEFICQGARGTDYESVTLCCKKGIKTCALHPSGFPRCVNAGSPQGNPSQTSSTSIYMVRDKNEFSLNGKAYLIKPHLTFEVPITIILDDNNYERENLETYKYQNHEVIFNNCESTLQNKISKTIEPAGGAIALEGKITIEIPRYALSEEKTITIEEHLLRNCYAPEENDDQAEILQIFEKKESGITTNADRTINQQEKKYLIIIMIILIK